MNAAGREGPDVPADRLGERLARDVAEVGRQEMSRVRRDLVGEPGPAGTAAVLLSAAGVCAVLAAQSGSTAALRLLEVVLPKRLAPIALTAGCVGAAGALARAGLKQLHAAGGGSKRLAIEIEQALGSLRARLRDITPERMPEAS